MMKDVLLALENTMLDGMREKLKADSPKFVQILEEGTSENGYNYLVAETELSSPVQPWSDLLSALLDLELGLDFFQLSSERLANSSSGRELHYFIQTMAIYMLSSLERLEHLCKRLVRSKVTGSLGKELEAISDGLKGKGLIHLRHTSAHGRFTGTDRKIADTQTEYYWEPYSIIRLNENHLEGWHTAQKNNMHVLKREYGKQCQSFMDFIESILHSVHKELMTRQHSSKS